MELLAFEPATPRVTFYDAQVWDCPECGTSNIVGEEAMDDGVLSRYQGCGGCDTTVRWY